MPKQTETARATRAVFLFWQNEAGGFRHCQADGFCSASTSCSAATMQSRMAAASGAARSCESISVLSAIELITLLADPDWLDEATKSIVQFWRRKNARRKGLNTECMTNDSVVS
jgi:hypothetical protein